MKLFQNFSFISKFKYDFALLGIHNSRDVDFVF